MPGVTKMLLGISLRIPNDDGEARAIGTGHQCKMNAGEEPPAVSIFAKGKKKGRKKVGTN